MQQPPLEKDLARRAFAHLIICIFILIILLIPGIPLWRTAQQGGMAGIPFGIIMYPLIIIATPAIIILLFLSLTHVLRAFRLTYEFRKRMQLFILMGIQNS